MKKICTIFLSLFLMSSAVAKDVYVKGFKVKIYEKDSRSSNVLTSFKKGHKLELLKQKGSWSQVKFDGQKGWVQKILLSSKAPTARVSVLAKKTKVDLSSNARKRASSFTSAASARGLRSTIKDGDNKVDEQDFDELKKMESLHVEPEDALPMIDIVGESKK